MCPLSVLSAPFFLPDGIFILRIQTCRFGARREPVKEVAEIFSAPVTSYAARVFLHYSFNYEE